MPTTEAQKRYARVYYQRNKDKSIASIRASERKNPEIYRKSRKHHRETHQEYYRKHAKKQYLADPAKKKRKVREWQEAHPQQVRLIGRRKARRRRAHNARGFCTDHQRLARLAFYGWRCYLCGEDWWSLVERDRTWDHIIPLARGGTDWPSNQRPACRSCNSRKGAR